MSVEIKGFIDEHDPDFHVRHGDVGPDERCTESDGLSHGYWCSQRIPGRDQDDTVNTSEDQERDVEDVH